MRAQDPADRFAAVARDLASQPTPAATVDRIAGLAVEALRGCDHAGISLVDHRRIQTVAATDDVVAKGDQQQYALDEGPCLDSIRHEHTVRSPQLAADGRWPAMGALGQSEPRGAQHVVFLTVHHRTLLGRFELVLG